jgi:hypothetical protein
MLKLNASYSKKVPAEGEYSSQQYHCSVEVELSDKLEAADIQAKIHETFGLVRDAVEAELHGGVRSEPARPPMRVLPLAKPAPAPVEKASNRQVKYVTDLAARKNIALSALNSRIQQRFGVPGVYELSRTDASKLVDELKAAA